jgi:hypothetical protein
LSSQHFTHTIEKHQVIGLKPYLVHPTTLNTLSLVSPS